jgi:hypothetical protein
LQFHRPPRLAQFSQKSNVSVAWAFVPDDVRIVARVKVGCGRVDNVLNARSGNSASNGQSVLYSPSGAPKVENAPADIHIHSSRIH